MLTPKKLVTVIAIVSVACSVTVNAAHILKFGCDEIGMQSVRLLLTCLLSYSLIRGWNRGRWIAIILMGLGGAVSVIGGVSLLARPPVAIGVMSLGAIYLACMVGLLTPMAAAHFKAKDDVEPMYTKSSDA